MNVTDSTIDDRTIALRITDATDAEHRLTLARDGAVTDHWCDRYPADDEPTALEREWLARAERFAKYYVDRTADGNALDPYVDRIGNPDRVAVAALVLATMSQTTLEQRLEACYEQLTAPRTDEEPPVARPRQHPDAELQRVEQDLSLSVEPDAAARLSGLLAECDGLATLRNALDVRPDRPDEDLFERLDRILRTAGSSGHTDGRVVDADAPLCVRWGTDGPTRAEYGDGTEPQPDGSVAARLQLIPHHRPIISIAAFQRTLVDHLRCQLRDCYVGMGLRPPNHARVTGPGIAACTAAYESVDGLQRYHDEHSIVDWSALAPRPDL